MRKRNIKINVFLNEDEKKMLEEKSNTAKLSQSDFIRKLIEKYYEYQPQKNDIDNAVISLSELIDNLSSFKRQMEFLHYSDYSNFIAKQITNVEDIINQLKK